MKRIYRTNPAYREFQLKTRDALIAFFNRSSSYIISLPSDSNGLIGTVYCDGFQFERIGNHIVWAFQRNSNDCTRLLLDGDIEYADCFCDEASGTTVVFLKLSGAEMEHQILVS